MRLVHRAVGALIAGVLLVGVAWAGVGLAPVSSRGTARLADAEVPGASAAAVAAVGALAGQEGGADGATAPDLSVLRPLAGDEFLAGAAVTSLAPDPALWQTEGCSELLSNFPEEVTHLAGPLAEGALPGWPRSPDCVYLGGYGIGPARAATGVDPYAGVNVRSLAISNGTTTLVWQIVDMVGFFNEYRADLCDGCGILDIRTRIATETGIPVANLAIGSTHTHGGADGYGAWGGIPRWYREQIRDQIVASAYDALRAMQPAAITVGAVEARAFNGERRDTYYSTPDYGAGWLQAVSRRGRSVIATLVNYAAHPTVLGDQPLLHADWPGAMAKAMGDTLGGVGLVFEGGLGNVSPSRPRNAEADLTGDGVVDDYDQPAQMGIDFAAFIAADIARGGTRLVTNGIKAVETTIEHPVTNWALTGLGVSSLLDRDFLPGSAGGVGGNYVWSKQADDGLGAVRTCASAAPTTVKTQVSAFRVGELTVLTGPGELFSNITEVVKSKVRYAAASGGQTMVFGQTQDSLGYIIQSFEVDALGGAPSYADANGSPGEYEETFLLDRCFGDHVLDAQLALAAQLDG